MLGSPFVYFATIPVCGVPQSAYLPLQENLDFSKSAIYQYGCATAVCSPPYKRFGLPDPNPWTYGTYNGGVALSFTTSGGDSEGCGGVSRSARVVLYCDPFGQGFQNILQPATCQCKNNTYTIIIYIIAYGATSVLIILVPVVVVDELRVGNEQVCTAIKTAVTSSPTNTPTTAPSFKHSAAPTDKQTAVPTYTHTAAPTHLPTTIINVSSCEYPVIFTSCLSAGANLTLCLSRDSSTCTTASQCTIIGVYDRSDIHFANNWISPVNFTQTYFIDDNLYPIDALGLGYMDPVSGPTLIDYYYDSYYFGNYYVGGYMCDRTPYKQSGTCSVVGCDLHCDNGLNYDMSAVSDGSASGTGPQSVYPVYGKA